jgi:hypothetical protein
MTIAMRPAKRYIDGLVSGKIAFVRVPLNSIKENDEFSFSFEPNYSGRLNACAETIQEVRLSDMTKQEVLDAGFDNPEFCYLGRTCGFVMEGRTQDNDPKCARERARETLKDLCGINCMMHEPFPRMFMRHFGETFLGRNLEDDPDGIEDLTVSKVRFSILENSLELIKTPGIHLH